MSKILLFFGVIDEEWRWSSGGFMIFEYSFWEFMRKGGLD